VISAHREALLGGAVLLIVAAGTAAAQQQPKTIAPETPQDGASVGKKLRFVVRVEGADVEKLRFRIELSRDEFKSIATTFDQLKDASGWAVTALADQTPGAVYVPREPLAGGDYQWRVASWDGLSWKEGGDHFRVQIDDVPPEDVDGVRMTRDPGGPCVGLAWQPVVTDRDGRPERVAMYHVYRYAARGPTHPIGPFQVGETTGVTFEDCDAASLEKPILFYRVVAEDEAGNIPGRRF
jgi:hypothetical protein